MIPYVVDDFTRSAAPAKLNEYLALGKPVVSAALPEVQRFIEENGEVARLATGTDEFHQALLDGLNDDAPGRRTWRRDVASKHSWSLRVEEMSRLIEDCLPPQTIK